MYLISMKTAHSTFDLRCAYVRNPFTRFLSYEYAGKQSNQAGSVEQDIGLINRHMLTDAQCKIILPDTVLPTHPLFVGIFLFAFQETL